MILLYPLVLLAIIALSLWGIVSIWRAKRTKWVYRGSLLLFLAVSIALAHHTTYKYQSFPNPNTQVFGWPMPYVIFQRNSPTSPWLDYVGLGTYIAFPVNVILFAFVVIVVICLIRAVQQRLNQGKTA